MATIRQSQPYIILLYMLGIMMIGFAFLVLLTPMNEVYNYNYNSSSVTPDLTHLNTASLCRAEGHTWKPSAGLCVSDYQVFYQRSRTMVLWLPFILIFPLIVWIFIKSNERQQSY